MPPDALVSRNRVFGTYYWSDRANVIRIFLVMPHQGKIPGAATAFSALVSSAEKRALAIPSWETDNFVTLDFFESIISQLLYFCGAYTRGVCVGISGAMANSDNKQVFFRGSNKLCRSHGFSWR